MWSSVRRRAYLECSSSTDRGTELCDGLDNDCDGLIDEVEDLQAPLIDTATGVCADVRKVCAGPDGWVVPNLSEVSGYETDEALCDGLDNDCDGLIDEGLTNAPLAENQSGICAGATKVCEGISGWMNPDYSAIAGYTAADDVCDGIDSNCNGVADEDVVLPTADKTAGVCQGLTKVCAGAAGLVEPNYGDLVDYAGTDSVCDGLDNDCDGLIDEDLGDAPLADTQLGVCAGAVKTCAGAQGWLNPDYTSLDSYASNDSVCDGLDNDCDGEIDESLDLPDAELTAGVCQGQVKVCDGDNGLVEPTYTDIVGYQADEVLCDGLDNDCDTIVDEAYREGGSRSYLEPVTGETLYLGDTCGVGACAGGTVQCAASQAELECSSGDASAEEVCDGIDNDCDGEVDEGLEGALAANQVGVCAGARWFAVASVDGLSLTIPSLRCMRVPNHFATP